MFDFARGHPNSSLLPIEETCCVLKDLCRETGGAQEALWQALQYGNDEGNTSFLAELKAFLSRHTRNDDFGALGVSSTRTEDETKTNFFVTSGVSHGIELLCATQTRPGDVVLVERPTYFLAGGIFRTHGLVVRGLPMRKSTGDLNVDKLLELVENGTMEAPRMIYIIPTHQNPTAHTMDIGDRIKLATFARRHGVLVVSDEVYHLLDWRDSESDGPRPAGMASISSKLHDIVDTSSHGECVSVSSFTKIFAPGIRLGWVEASPGTIKSLSNYGYIQSQGGCAPFIGEIMRTALKSHVADDVLSKLTKEYKLRSEKLCSLLATERRIVVVNRTLGGYFTWIKFPEFVDCEQFLEFCKARVKFLPGVRCDIASGLDDEIDHRLFASYARLCFADLDVKDLESGVAVLVECFREYMLILESDQNG